MTEFKKKNLNERGTLLIEAIAMLGLIAMVTPTLYKKSAERLQEIQDINAAGQARTFNHVIETFIKSEFSEILSATYDESNLTLELSMDDSSKAGFYHKGYSSYMPYGYANDVKNYGEPRVFVRNDNGRLTSYILYPVNVDPGKKRAARLASLVGANGGIITKPVDGSNNDVRADGTGGAWALDENMLSDLVGNDGYSTLVENSLMVTSTEPITITNDDSDKFLYRLPPEVAGDPSKHYRNQMVTNLYMGGHSEDTDEGRSLAEQYYSIYNVRRLSLNTNCNADFLNNSSGTGGSNIYCDPKVADLYIGKPFAETSSGTIDGNKYEIGYQHDGNTGAAWIYGNLSALKDNFRLFREGGTSSHVEGYTAEMERDADAYDVLEFARIGSSSGDVEFSVFRAQNAENSAEVAMLDRFVVASKGGASAAPEFSVGFDSSNATNEGSLLYAKGDGANRIVRINSIDGTQPFNGDITTEISKQGGKVYINGSSIGTPYEEGGDTYINEGGGSLTAGKDGDWILAEGRGNSATVSLLLGSSVTSGTDERIFSVGNTEKNSSMIWANSSVVSLRGGLLRAYGHPAENIDNSFAGGDGNPNNFAEFGSSVALTGQLTAASRYTDILGSTYFGKKAISSSVDDEGLIYNRYWNVGVAGSAWVDDLLFARDAWFKRSGFKELHAGFSTYADYSSHPERGWLNVYGSSVVIRDPAVASSGVAGDGDTMFYADSRAVRIYDKIGGAALFHDGMAKIGYTPDGNSSFSNLFVADEGSANVIASSLVNIYTETNDTSSKVNIQDNAMLFTGKAGDSSVTYPSNTIEARAGKFAIQTANKGQNIDNDMQFYINKDEMRVKYVDLGVYDDNSAAVFQVMPNKSLGATEGSANVQVRGSFHVTGNEVIHIASNEGNRAGNDEDVDRSSDAHAMFEVDPKYVQVWAKNGNNYAGTDPNTYYAMLKINPSDIDGEALSSTVMDSASVYIRRGAIELEESTGSSHAADEGYGYIRANRFVSNADVPAIPSTNPGGTQAGNPYDQYMVNPAYTSVMHDIKLTTRGGARLSDILPDYVLKGVYNLVNNRAETSPDQEETDMMHWAHPYIGIMPYAVCPPGYRNLATVMPISFRMGEAGDIMQAQDMHFNGGNDISNRYIVNPSPRQGKTLDYAVRHNLPVLQDLTLNEVSSVIINELIRPDNPLGDFSSTIQLKTEGWFWGLKAYYDGNDWTNRASNLSSVTEGAGSNSVTYWQYQKRDSETFSVIPTPIYFQQNTWLKTSLVPDTQGWKAYMGFLYDKNYWGTTLGGIGATGTVMSNYNEQGYNDSTGASIPGGDGSLVWNMFPVPTHSLEGHGTVYCYFDRSSFIDSGWGEYIDDIDQLGGVKGTHDYRDPHTKDSDSPYTRRLNDPTLKYDDPW